MKQVQVLLNEEEQKVLVSMIDIAVKTQGLQAAQAGVILAQKIQGAKEYVPPEPEEPPKKKK